MTMRASASSYRAEGQDPRAAARQTSLCAACPKLCRHTCPVAEASGREAFTPWALMSSVHLERMGAHPAPIELSQDVYACSGCRACQGFCHFHQDVPGVLFARRAQAYRQDEAPEGARRLAARFHAWGNLYQEGLQASAFAGIDVTRLRPSARELIWIDSATLFARPQVVTGLLRLLEMLDLKEVGIYAGPLACCGEPLYQAGDLDGFRLYARSVAKGLGGLRRIYSTSPDCAETLQRVYPDVGIRIQPEVCSVLELLSAHRPALVRLLEAPALVGAQRASAQRASAQTARTALQVPCAMARGLGLGEQVRGLATLLLGYSPREAQGDSTVPFCTGAGGGLPEILPNLADAVTQRCITRLGLASGERVLTACPKSARRLETALPGRVDDLLPALLRRLGALS